MLLAILFSFCYLSNLDNITETFETETLSPEPEPEPSTTPAPSESGVPSVGIVLGTCAGCFVVMTATVSVLCFKKEKEEGFTTAAQILLEKNEI
ncbi:hypothetical protein TRFO_41642 [Tritrichomonas foetus]|uniref:Uncharacterized protein n=1 Tax=Tritrichomonas foetus TaxID=1144522 RepID=A0A1J4KZJ6_9EUKA|nr:hypothetical protein TRFO_41642 [Tritrichomonas foetus]|eukprot:OHT16681.1 hypothetical protein TRFO_41642 [Tritrichomonas foetus]